MSLASPLLLPLPEQLLTAAAGMPTPADVAATSPTARPPSAAVELRSTAVIRGVLLRLSRVSPSPSARFAAEKAAPGLPVFAETSPAQHKLPVSSPSDKASAVWKYSTRRHSCSTGVDAPGPAPDCSAAAPDAAGSTTAAGEAGCSAAVATVLAARGAVPAAAAAAAADEAAAASSGDISGPGIEAGGPAAACEGSALSCIGLPYLQEGHVAPAGGCCYSASHQLQRQQLLQRREHLIPAHAPADAAPTGQPHHNQQRHEQQPQQPLFSQQQQYRTLQLQRQQQQQQQDKQQHTQQQREQEHRRQQQEEQQWERRLKRECQSPPRGQHHGQQHPPPPPPQQQHQPLRQQQGHGQQQQQRGQSHQQIFAQQSQLHQQCRHRSEEQQSSQQHRQQRHAFQQQQQQLCDKQQQQRVGCFGMTAPPPLTPVARTFGETAAACCSYFPRLFITIAQQLLLVSHAIALLLVAQELSPVPSQYLASLFLEQQETLMRASSSRNSETTRNYALYLFPGSNSSTPSSIPMCTSRTDAATSSSSSSLSDNSLISNSVTTSSLASNGLASSSLATGSVNNSNVSSHSSGDEELPGSAAFVSVASTSSASLAPSSSGIDLLNAQGFPPAAQAKAAATRPLTRRIGSFGASSFLSPAGHIRPETSPNSSPSPLSNLHASPPPSPPLPTHFPPPASSVSSPGGPEAAVAGARASPSPSSRLSASFFSSFSSPSSTSWPSASSTERSSAAFCDAAAELETLLLQLAAAARAVFLGTAGSCMLLVAVPLCALPYARLCMRRAHNRVLINQQALRLSNAPSLLTEVIPEVVLACSGAALLLLLLFVEQRFCFHVFEVVSFLYLPFFSPAPSDSPSSRPSFFFPSSSPLPPEACLPAVAFFAAAKKLYASYVYLPTLFALPTAVALPSSLAPTPDTIPSAVSPAAPVAAGRASTVGAAAPAALRLSLPPSTPAATGGLTRAAAFSVPAVLSTAAAAAHGATAAPRADVVQEAATAGSDSAAVDASRTAIAAVPHREIRHAATAAAASAAAAAAPSPPLADGMKPAVAVSPTCLHLTSLRASPTPDGPAANSPTPYHKPAAAAPATLSDAAAAPAALPAGAVATRPRDATCPQSDKSPATVVNSSAGVRVSQSPAAFAASAAPVFLAAASSSSYLKTGADTTPSRPHAAALPSAGGASSSFPSSSLASYPTSSPTLSSRTSPNFSSPTSSSPTSSSPTSSSTSATAAFVAAAAAAAVPAAAVAGKLSCVSLSPVAASAALLIGTSACGCLYGLLLPYFSSSIITSVSLSALAFSLSLFFSLYLPLRADGPSHWGPAAAPGAREAAGAAAAGAAAATLHGSRVLVLLDFLPLSLLPCLALGAALCCCCSLRYFRKYSNILCWQERCSCCLRTCILLGVACCCAAAAAMQLGHADTAAAAVPSVDAAAGSSTAAVGITNYIPLWSLLHGEATYLPPAPALVRAAARLLLLLPLLELLLLYHSFRKGAAQARLQQAFFASFCFSRLAPGSNNVSHSRSSRHHRSNHSRRACDSFSSRSICGTSSSSRRGVVLQDANSGDGTSAQSSLHENLVLPSGPSSYSSHPPSRYSVHAGVEGATWKSAAAGVPAPADSPVCAAAASAKAALTNAAARFATASSLAREVSLALLPGPPPHGRTPHDPGHETVTALHYQLDGEDSPASTVVAAASTAAAGESCKSCLLSNSSTPRNTYTRLKSFLPCWLLPGERPARERVQREDSDGEPGSRMAALMLTQAPAHADRDSTNPFSP